MRCSATGHPLLESAAGTSARRDSGGRIAAYVRRTGRLKPRNLLTRHASWSIRCRPAAVGRYARAYADAHARVDLWQ